MFHLHRHQRKMSVCKELTLVSFFIAITFAIVDTVWSIYLESFGLSSSYIGFLSSFFVVYSLFISFNASKVLERVNKFFLLICSLFIIAISLIVLGLFPTMTVLLIVWLLFSTFSVFRMLCFDILFRDSSSKKELNAQEGFLYAILNVGWLVGPLIAGFFLLQYDLNAVFIAAGAFLLFGILLLLLVHPKAKKRKLQLFDDSSLKNIKEFFQKKLVLPYIISGGIEVWWGLVYIYVPLFMIGQGLKESTVALFIALVVFPLIFWENFIGKLSAKIGFRTFFVFGFGFLALFSFILFFIEDIVVQLAIIVGGSVFVAFLEPLQDTFFFKQIKQSEEEKFHPIYRTAGSVGSLIGRFSIACVLLFLPYSFAYLTVGVFMLLCALSAIKISTHLR